MEIKDCFMQNLTALRKSASLTQAELAEKLNYSDKAVSKWERGESMPDVYVLKQIADYFNITIDALISPNLNSTYAIKHAVGKKRISICLFLSAIVWLVAICFFAFAGIITPYFNATWLTFIYAGFVNFLLVFIFCCIWKENFWKTITLSGMVWFAILSIFLTIKTFLVPAPKNLWMLFLIGIPAQCLIVVLAGYVKPLIKSFRNNK